jgi:hypothetical protein
MILVPSELHIQLVFPAFSCRPHLFTNTVRSRSLRDHTFKKLIKITILVREGVWGLIFEFEGTSGGPCRELFFEVKSPPVNAACSLLLLFVMAEAVAEAEAEAVAKAEAVADAAKCSEAGKARLEPRFNFHPLNHYK